MANLLNFTRFKSPSTAATPFNITIPATAAGSKLVCVAGGGAVVTAKLGIGGTNFTKRTQSLSTREVAAQDIVDVGGGTTTIEISLNGPENVDGIIFEFASGTLGNFIAGANEGGSGQTTNSQGQINTGSVVTSGASVLFSMYTSGDSSSLPAHKFFGLEPLGKQLSNEFITPDASKTRYWSMIGISDQLAAGTFIGRSSLATGQSCQHVMWAYENLAPGTPTYANPYANAIAAENSLPGSLSGSWFGVTTNANIAGFTDSISYAPGDTVNFKVDSNNTAFNVEIFRQGFYGYPSFGAKEKAVVAGSAFVQPAPTINARGGTETTWSTSATWAIPANATPGIYVYNMRRTDNTSFVAGGIFVVRSTVPGSQNNQILHATSEFTWQAYNAWGARTDAGNGYAGFTGRSLYGQAPAAVAIGSRAFSVSFDRPLGTISANNSSYHWDSEGGVVNFLEANGYDVAYMSSTDIDKDPTIPSKFKIALSSGHSEYWTDNLRDAYEDARDAGTSLIFLSSNTALWRVRFDPSDTNRRNMICYKDSHDTAGFDGTTKYDPVSYTGTWRDIRTTPGGVNNTFYRPESGMTGQWFIGNGTFIDTVTVSNAFSSLPIWRSTRVATGGTIAVRATTSNTNTSLATSIAYTQPGSTQIGDLLVIALVTSGNPGSLTNNGMREVRRADNGNNQTTILLVGHAFVAGASGGTINWNNSVAASVAITVYSGAVWQDTDASVNIDNGGTALHATRSITNAFPNTWAICAFADSTTNGSAKTTSWTPGAGLTARVGADNAAAVTSPWNSVALMDTNGAVSQGAHQYSATAQFANPSAAACIMYISPGTPLFNRSIGTEWDFVKWDEPSTPTNLVMLSEQALPLNGLESDYNGHAYNGDALHKFGLSLYKAASGALVFNAGTWRYQWGISRFRASDNDLGGEIDVAMQQSMLNLIKDMGVAPTTILGTLENIDATPLVDPGPAASADDYGLTITAPPAYESLFPASREPTLGKTLASDGVDYTLGTVFTATTNGAVHGIKWFFPDSLPNDHVIGLLYSWTNDGAGTELARLSFTNTQSGWNQALFSVPVNITANTKYVAAVWTVDKYTQVTGQFTSSGVTSGSLTAPQDQVGTRNGKRIASVGAAAFPASTNAADGYLADVLFIGGGTVEFEGWGIPIS